MPLPMLQPRAIGRQSLTVYVLADCDPDDAVGCAAGLVCGEDNCAQFHEISEATGFTDTSDCCEGEPERDTPGLKDSLCIITGCMYRLAYLRVCFPY